MTTAAKLVSLAAIATIAAFAAGCTTSGGGGGTTAPRAAATPFDGEWQSADGAAASRFAGGVFSTTDTSTDNKVADGSYVLTDGRTAQITVKSLVRGSTSNVTCLLATESQLNCTNSSGATFILNRRQTAPA